MGCTGAPWQNGPHLLKNELRSETIDASTTTVDTIARAFLTTVYISRSLFKLWAESYYTTNYSLRQGIGSLPLKAYRGVDASRLCSGAYYVE
jgi:hypothetical protein